MRMHLAVINDNGNGTTGADDDNVDNDGPTGDDDDDDQDGATDD